MPELLHHLAAEAAQRAPEAEAIVCGAESLSYGELWRQAKGLARVLKETGLERQGRVAVLLGKSPKVAAAFYGTFAAGGVLTPIDPKSPAKQVARILRGTGATHLVTEPARAKVVREALASCPEITHVLGLTPTEGSGSLEEEAETPSWETVPWETILGEASDRPFEVPVLELDPCYILHTSGSTGLPKLIRHTHASAMSFVRWAAAEYELRPEDRLSNHSSHHTCFATFDYYAAARAGAATVLLTPAVLMMPGSLAELLEKERVSIWYSVPTALVQLSLRGDLESRDLSALRWVLFAGETFPEKHLRRLLEQLPGARFSHVYGSTEVNVCTYYHLPHPLPEELPDPLPIGRACSNAETRVEDGELLVRGSTLMTGYWEAPEKNAQAFRRLPVAGGFAETYFRTGDRVEVLEDGNLAFLTRADLQIKVRGFRVELGEVEAALLSLEAVEEAAAVATPDGEGSSAIRAAVTVAPGSKAGERELAAGLKKILPAHALPGEILILDAFPRTPTGKVDRGALKDLTSKDRASS